MRLKNRSWLAIVSLTAFAMVLGAMVWADNNAINSRTFELTNPKANDPNAGGNAVPVTIASGAVWYGPEVQLSAPAVGKAFYDIEASQASGTVSVSGTWLLSAASGRTTTSSDQSSGTYQTTFNLGGQSADGATKTLATASSLPPAHFVRPLLKNNGAVTVTITGFAFTNQ